MTHNDPTAFPDDEVPIVMLQPLDRPDDRGHHRSTWRPTVTGEPIGPGEPGEPKWQAAAGPPFEEGCWLLLRDAVRVVGSLERLYQLAEEGVLESRQDEDGQIEVWIESGETYAAPGATHAAPSPAATVPGSAAAESLGEATDPRGTGAGDLGQMAAALIGPLTEAHERHLELARENGSLSARVIVLERELQDARAQVNAAPLAEAHERRLQLMRENAVLAERLAGVERALEDARERAAGSAAPLAEAHERELQLARENGALAERLAGLVRELTDMRAKADERAALMREIEQLRAEAADSEAPLAEARERQEQLTHQNDLLQQRLASLEQELQAKREAPRDNPVAAVAPLGDDLPAQQPMRADAEAAHDETAHAPSGTIDAQPRPLGLHDEPPDPFALDDDRPSRPLIRTAAPPREAGIGQELELDEERARRAASADTADNAPVTPSVTPSRGVLQVSLLILLIVVVIAIASGAGWVFARGI
jgi:predicted  nucleic acid-binding Zn-ribbon protein